MTVLLGMIGSACASILFLPQVIKSYKTKQTRDISWFTVYIGLVNGLTWTTYGAIKDDPFIWVTNAFLFVGLFLLFLLKRKYG